MNAELADILLPVEADMVEVNRLIEARLTSSVPIISELGSYIVASGGKRLRPNLVVLCAKACDYSGYAHIILAAIIEFVHTATLMHDDVVDKSMMRRGKETVNSRWGNRLSILVGDFLYSRSFEMIIDLDDYRILQELASATNIVAEGEVLQALNCNNPNTTEAEYMNVIERKTAKLFEVAARSGAIIAKKNDTILRAMAGFGQKFGLAYQLVDDMLDYTGNNEIIGKNIGDDLADGKSTLPLIVAMREGNNNQAQLIRDSIVRGRLENLPEITKAIESTKAIEYTENLARKAAQEAIMSLKPLPNSPFKEALTRLAHYSVSRSY